MIIGINYVYQMYCVFIIEYADDVLVFPLGDISCVTWEILDPLLRGGRIYMLVFK